VVGGLNVKPDTADKPSARAMVVNPLSHSGWDSLVTEHPRGSFFHGKPWASVLHDTYGHSPHYFCQFADDQLEELLPVMEVSSAWTGRRGVSLPFTDFCPSLKPRGPGQNALLEIALAHGRERRWRYLELRGGGYDQFGARPSLAFYGHVIDLASNTEMLFKRLEGAMRRGIRKAQDTKLRVEFSNTRESTRTFYGLHCRTRRRHGLPPQPIRFFDNIAHHVLLRGSGFVVTARLEERPVAAAVFLHHDAQALYKFGASDYMFQHLRPTNLLMWEAIKRYAQNGFSRLHLGRTSLSNEGLRRFKLGFGATEERIEYYKYDLINERYVTDVDRAEGWFNRVFKCLPPPLLRLVGRMLYPHLS
jgi:hypothetical protein